MAAATQSPETDSQVQGLTLSQLLDLPTLDYWESRANEIELYPDRTVIQGVDKKTLLLRLEDFAYKL